MFVYSQWNGVWALGKRFNQMKLTKEILKELIIKSEIENDHKAQEIIDKLFSLELSID